MQIPPPSAVPPAPEDFHLFLLVGQSNMAGRGDITPEDQVAYPQILALNAAGEWVPAVDPIHWDKPIAGVGLARSFALDYLADHPGVTIGLIPAACGGSPIATWMPGAFFADTNSHPYDDAIARARLAMQRGTLKGILWHQGESDSHPGLAEVYHDRLAELIARMRRDLGAQDIPFVLGQLGRFAGAPWGEPTAMVDGAIRAVAEEVPNCGFVSSSGLTSKPDNLHFNTESLHEFGRRYYAEFRRLIRNQTLLQHVN
jgi:hypothetical protein